MSSPIRRKVKRKPAPLKPVNLHVYANFFPHSQENEQFIYIGGKSYNESKQIHLTLEESKRLHEFLSTAIRWQESGKR